MARNYDKYDCAAFKLINKCDAMRIQKTDLRAIYSNFSKCGYPKKRPIG